jgi:phosphoglycerate dehydrogenase-like enzyme
MRIYIRPTAFPQQQRDLLKARFPHHEWIEDDASSSLAEVWIAFPQSVTRKHLDLMPNLKWIHLLMAGFNTVDLEDLDRRGIVLTNSKDVFSIQIAEDVFSKILAINRDVRLFHDQQKAHVWKTVPDEFELYGSTVGIIGAGSIGSEVAKRMKAFHATVLGWKRTMTEEPFYDRILTGEEGLTELLAQSDYVVVAIPLNGQTRHLINAKRLSIMKPTAVLVNVARGEIVEQDDLIEALRTHSIRAAALDVTTPEPLPADHPLWDLPNLFLTPHNASSSQRMLPRMVDLTIENIVRYEQNRPLLHVVQTKR